MSDRGFENLIASIEDLIGVLETTVTVWTKKINTYTGRASGGDKQAQENLATCQRNLNDAEAAIKELKKLLVLLDRDWSPIDNRVIGHVVWSPPLTGFNLPYGYTRDVCVIKLDKDKFLPNFRGNVIDLGACRPS